MKTKNNYNKRKKRMNLEKGSSFIELLISMALISFIVVSVLDGISQKKVVSQNLGDKNAAVYLAETRIEELLKFSCDQLQEETRVDYIISKGYGFEFFNADQKELKQFRRTSTVQKDLIGKLATITVRVEYSCQPKAVKSSVLVYPFAVELSTRRTLQ